MIWLTFFLVLVLTTGTVEIMKQAISILVVLYAKVELDARELGSPLSVRRADRIVSVLIML